MNCKLTSRFDDCEDVILKFIANNKNMIRYAQKSSTTIKRFKTVPVALFAGSTRGAGKS